ncbi:MAG: hypothetical protein KDK70_09835, partial [Myxococcales bacterium]|nr:hypothetical protein [Myxococcales bacterium]
RSAPRSASRFSSRSAPRSAPQSADAVPRPARPGVSMASVFVDGGVSGILLPGLGGRLAAGAALGWGQARVDVAALHEFARAVAHPQGIDAGADLSMTAGRASACWAPALGRVTLPVCGGVEVGAIAASGFGLEQKARVRSPWAALVAHVRPTVWVTRWLGLGAAVELPVALLRPSFVIDDYTEPLVHVGPAGVRVGLSIALAFFRRSGGDPGKEQ